jgi:hypothetical protein
MLRSYNTIQSGTAWQIFNSAMNAVSIRIGLRLVPSIIVVVFLLLLLLTQAGGSG